MDTKEMTKAVIEKLEGWATSFVSHLPNFMLAIVCIVLAFFVGKMVRKHSGQLMNRMGTSRTISRFLSRLIFWGIILLGLLLALSVMDLTKTVSSVLAGLGIIGLALGFAFQDTAANFMSGIYITFNQPYAIGDFIETNNGNKGFVQDINLRVTKIRALDGHIIYVPNRFLFQDYFINYTEEGKLRLRLECGISYGEDLEKVERVALKAMKTLPSRKQDEEVSLFWTGFGDSSINFSVNIWYVCSREERLYRPVLNEAVKALKKAFDENDIMIPFPIRTLDFGIKGGVPFNEELNRAQNGTSFSPQKS